MVFENKVFAVTGGGNGIGREVVLNLLSKGAKVVALDLSEQGLAETKELTKNYENNYMGHKLNVANRNEVEALPAIILEKFGKIDGILNVAGIVQPFIKVNDLSYEQMERVMNVNFYGSLYMMKTFLPILLKNESESYILNVASMGGFLPVPGQSLYGASKAALKLLTEGLYAECLGTNVRVSIVFPGGVATNILTNSNVKMEAPKTEGKTKSYTMTTAPKAAEIIVNGMAKNKFRILVGKDAKIMDFLYRMNPKRAVHMITKQMKDLLK